jgi:hypothetical protein
MAVRSRKGRCGGPGRKGLSCKPRVEPANKARGKRGQAACEVETPGRDGQREQHRRERPPGYVGWRGPEEARGELRRPLLPEGGDRSRNGRTG